MKKNYGKHLIIDAYGIEEKKLKDRQAIRKLLADLPKKCGMRTVGSPVLKKIASEFYPDWGLSGFVILYESHISVHTWPNENFVAMDFYSCKDFDERAVIEHLKNYWGVNKMKIRVVTRG